MMKAVTLSFAAATFLSFAGSPTFAQNAKGRYCLNAATGGSTCGFTSIEQCRETMQGRNGWCTEQVDFEAWAASHGQRSPNGRPENSFAYYPSPSEKLSRRPSPAANEPEDLRKKDMPTKGVGAE
jgi:Protein of unknown function (DUF3551)